MKQKTMVKFHPKTHLWPDDQKQRMKIILCQIDSCSLTLGLTCAKIIPDMWELCHVGPLMLTTSTSTCSHSNQHHLHPCCTMLPFPSFHLLAGTYFFHFFPSCVAEELSQHGSNTNTIWMQHCTASATSPTPTLLTAIVTITTGQVFWFGLVLSDTSSSPCRTSSSFKMLSGKMSYVTLPWLIHLIVSYHVLLLLIRRALYQHHLTDNARIASLPCWQYLSCVLHLFWVSQTSTWPAALAWNMSLPEYIYYLLSTCR